MEILDKYKDIITRIEEMCTSTAAMAPYPTGGISVTTIHSRGRKGKSRKAMLNYKYTKQWGNKDMDITETMNAIATLCEAIIKGEVISEDEFTKERIKNNVKSFFGLEPKRHDSYFTQTGKELREKRKAADDAAEKVVKELETAKRASGYRKQVHMENASDAERAAKKASIENRAAKGNFYNELKKRNATAKDIRDMYRNMVGDDY